MEIVDRPWNRRPSIPVPLYLVPGSRLHIVADKPNTLAEAQPAPRRWRPTVRYLSQTEVHVYALSIGASVLLSFFPFLIVMLTLIRDVFHFPAAERALILALGD